MAPDPRIRASDADRDRVAEALREHHAAGRLTMEEFGERLDRAYAAKTLGELDGIMSDLPAIDLYQLPIPATQRAAPPAPAQPYGRLSPVWRAAWAGWASITVLCIVIWLLSSPGGYFWPVWIFAPWGAAMGVRWVLGAAPRGHHHPGPDARRARREELRAQRSQMRQDIRSARDGMSQGLPWNPPEERGGSRDR